MQNWIRDLGLALRLMRRAPGHTLAAVLTLGLAIGATTAIFTVVDATLVRGLPYTDPDRLVQVTMTRAGTSDEMESSYPTFLDWIGQTTSFRFLGGYSARGGVASFGDGPTRLVDSATVTADFFRTLGVEPALGRDFPAGDEDLADKHVALLSHGFWQRQFGGAREAVGASFTYNGSAYTVTGVLPASFQFAPMAPVDFYTPVERLPFEMRRNLHWLNVIGRLEDDVSHDQAASEMGAISEHLGRLYPESNRDLGVRIIPLREAILGDIQPILLWLLAAVGILLLIACVNVANLMLARAAYRRKEIAVRVALGASRSRLVRQWMTEALALACGGAAAGLLFAQWILSGLLAAIPEPLFRFMPYLDALQTDARALAFTTGVAVLTGLLFGLAPALQLTRPHPREALNDAARDTGRTAGHTRSILVAAQIALAVMLLAGAFLTTRSLLTMLHRDPGFNPDGLALLRVLLPQDRYPDAPRMVSALHAIETRLATLPGVEGVGMTNRAPFRPGNTVRFRLEHAPQQTAGIEAEAATRSVDPAYFPVLQGRLLRGRYFDARDEADGPPVLIVNRTLADRHFPGQDPVGQRLVFTFAPDQPAREIVGVIDDVREGPLDAEPQPALYNPLRRTGARVVEIVLRTGRDPAAHFSAAEGALTQVDPGLLVIQKTSMRGVVDDAPWVFVRRFPATLTSVFGGAALLLAAVGLFGTIMYLVAQRTREIGVRMALGARPGDVLRLVMLQGLKLAAAGIAAGLAGALVLARVMESLLFEVSASDPLTFFAVPVVVFGTAALATYIPARCAMRLDPLTAFRQE